MAEMAAEEIAAIEADCPNWKTLAAAAAAQGPTTFATPSSKSGPALAGRIGAVRRRLAAHVLRYADGRAGVPRS